MAVQNVVKSQHARLYVHDSTTVYLSSCVLPILFFFLYVYLTSGKIFFHKNWQRFLGVIQLRNKKEDSQILYICCILFIYCFYLLLLIILVLVLF